MANNYWEDNSLITASDEEKKENLQYEIDMLRRTCKDLANSNPKTIFQENLLAESLATHVRVLIDFFYDTKNLKYPNDLVAQDFLPKNISWDKIRPIKTKILEDAKNKADKQLAHLSTWRIKLKNDGRKAWHFPEILEDIEKVIKKFNEIVTK